MLENTVDLLCKAYRWIFSLLYGTENSAGTGFPRYHEKDIHGSNYPLTLPENTIAATVREIIAMVVEKDDRGKIW